MSYDDDTPDTWVYFDDMPASRPGVSYSSCGCVLPVSCRVCDGTAAEEREMWRMPRAERVALEIRNRELLAALNAPAPASREQKGEAA